MTAPGASGSSCLLTDRELEVLRCLPTRLSTVEIGTVLAISPNTVKTHVRNIYRKLGARSRNEAILHAAARRLLPGESAAVVSAPAAAPHGGFTLYG